MSAIGNPTAWRAQNLTRPYTSVWKMKRRPCCLPFKSPLIKTLLACNDGGSPIGLAGCGIRHFFAVTFGIWAQNWGGKREIKLRAGAGFRVFMGLGFKIRKGNRVAYGISIPFPTPLKPWSSRRRFFSHFASFRFTHDKLSARGLPPKLLFKLIVKVPVVGITADTPNPPGLLPF